MEVKSTFGTLPHHCQFLCRAWGGICTNKARLAQVLALALLAFLL
jgi:hypothetical protein